MAPSPAEGQEQSGAVLRTLLSLPGVLFCSHSLTASVPLPRGSVLPFRPPSPLMKSLYDGRISTPAFWKLLTL